MMNINHKQKIIEKVANDLELFETGYFITLNAVTNDVIRHESKIDRLIYWLSFYCYGRGFKRNEIMLKTVGVNEVGTVNQGLHTHLVIMHNNDTTRTVGEIERFIRKKWYRLVNANKSASEYGNLVDLRMIDDVKGCLEYMTKTHSHQPNEFNLQYF